MSDGTVVWLEGFATPNDGGEGLFVLKKGVPAKDNGGTIFSAAGFRDAGWFRIYDGPAVSVRWFGAKNDGSSDCADAVRKAQACGDVHFPAGVYLMSAVDVRSNRRYFGDGKGRTVIRKNNAARRKNIFVLSTYDFDGSGHAPSPVENIVIESMTLDFNLRDGWVDYQPPIAFRGKGSLSIRAVTIRDLEFIDSAQCVHPEAEGKEADDSWCINLSAPRVEEVTIEDCVSRAEGHQFVAGGGGITRGIRIRGNRVNSGWANGISVTTVSRDADFSDIEISGNVVVATAVASIYVGYDYGFARPLGKKTFRGIRVVGNSILIDEPVIYGHRLIGRKYPIGILIVSGHGTVEELTISGNNVRVADGYAGGDASFLKFQQGEFEIGDTRTLAEFAQPATGASVAMQVEDNAHRNSFAFVPGAIVTVAGGGYYQVESSRGKVVKLTPVAWTPGAEPGSTIRQGAKMSFVGGIWKNVLVTGNNANLRCLLQACFMDGVTFAGNSLRDSIRITSSVHGLTISGNAGLALDVRSGNVIGSVLGNSIHPGRTFGRGAVRLQSGTDGRTEFPELTNFAIVGNTLLQSVPETDVAVCVEGDSTNRRILLENNILTGAKESVRGVEESGNVGP